MSECDRVHVRVNTSTPVDLIDCCRPTGAGVAQSSQGRSYASARRVVTPLIYLHQQQIECLVIFHSTMREQGVKLAGIHGVSVAFTCNTRFRVVPSPNDEEASKFSV